MDSKIILLIMKNRIKLQKMIEHNAPPKKILKQSQKLDEYLFIQMIWMNRIRTE